MPARIASGPRGPRERGAALLTAMVSVAVLTALAVDLAYSARVSLQIAANARDELRAEYLARSGVTMGRLVLSFQQQLDQATGGGLAGNALTSATTATGTTATSASSSATTAAGGGLAALAGLAGLAGGGIPRVQLWNLVPVDRSFTDGLFSGAPPRPGTFVAADHRAQPERKPDADGPTFDTMIEDEARKVNAQFFGFTMGTDQNLRQRVQSLYQLICPARYDVIFDREDANGVRTTREDILVRLRDWVDEGDVTSTLGQGQGSTSAQCGLVIGQPPFVDAFGDENQLYDRGDDRYRTKNASMDSLDELYLVYGIGDAFMGAFGDALTVYLRQGDKQNVNTLDKNQLVADAFMLASPKNQPALFDPELGNKLVKAMRETTFNGSIAINAKTFGLLVAAAGIQIDQNLLADNGPFTDRSKVYRIRATGKAGAVQTEIDAVVRMEDTKVPGEQIAVPGRIIHWRED